MRENQQKVISKQGKSFLEQYAVRLWAEFTYVTGETGQVNGEKSMQN